MSMIRDMMSSDMTRVVRCHLCCLNKRPKINPEPIAKPYMGGAGDDMTWSS